VSTNEWELKRSYASQVYPTKGDKDPAPPRTYALKVDAEFRQVIVEAENVISRRQKSEIVFKMGNNREHKVRDILMRLGFGQTRTPLSAMVELGSRLAASTDGRSKASLLVVTIEEKKESCRICIYVFPEEGSYLLRTSAEQPTEATLEHLNSFGLESRLRKVARFEGKEIKSHFMSGDVVDFQFGAGPKSVADYFVTDFLAAEFALNSHKGTTVAASALKVAFERADSSGKQRVMEAAISLMADGRRAWSLQKIAEEFIPQDLQPLFLESAPNTETIETKFMLDKDLLRKIINYRVFQLKNGVWVSSPFSEVGKGVQIEDRGGTRTLIARGEVQAERVQRDAKRDKVN
jgi:37-kD nucleoid-associated bacterial protein